MKFGSLFSGIGGLDLDFQKAGMDRQTNYRIFINCLLTKTINSGILLKK